MDGLEGIDKRVGSWGKKKQIKESKKESKRKKKETHPAQWMGLKALITGLGVGGRKSNKKRKQKEK